MTIRMQKLAMTTLLLGAVALAGCSTIVHGTGEAGMSDEEMAAKDDAVCRSIGASPGTT